MKLFGKTQALEKELAEARRLAADALRNTHRTQEMLNALDERCRSMDHDLHLLREFLDVELVREPPKAYFKKRIV